MLSNTGNGLKTAHSFSACIKKTGERDCLPDIKYPAKIVMRWEAG
jgi:hypothetical protein